MHHTYHTAPQNITRIRRIEYRCDRGECGKRFDSRGSLRLHLRIHDNIVHKCPFCCWANAKYESLVHHLNIHCRVRLHKCSYCEESRYSRGDLNSHIENKHEIESDRYRCKLCEFKTHSRSTLTKHVQAHSKLKGM